MNQVSEGLKKPNTFRLASALVEAETFQDSGSCMPPKPGNGLLLFINLRKWADSLFISGLLNNFAQVKVKEVCITEWISHHIKFYTSHSKMLMLR